MTKKNFAFMVSFFALFAVNSVLSNDVAQAADNSVGIAAVSYVDRALESYATKKELAGKQGTLKAGANITIAEDGTISATDTDTQVTVDSALSSTSTNPVQNKVINTALAGKQDDLVPDTNIKGAGTVTVTEANGVITVTGGTPGTATDTVAGLMKLYNNTGTREDGTMTQKAISNQLVNKQGVIGDLADIRSGAQAGATALQPGDVGELALIDEITDSDIAADARIQMGKIDGLQEALQGKLSASDYGYIPTNENGTGEARIWVE